MVVEKDVNIPLWRENGGGSACSRTSILTRKSAHTPRVVQADGRSTRSSISSRARQIKDHEGDPFLSIDVLSKTNSQSSFRKDTGTSRYSGKTREHSFLTTSSDRPSSYSYGRDDDLSGVFSRYVSVMRPASLTSQARFSQGNDFARMPFKQAADIPVIEKTRMVSASPGQALMESTRLAVHIVNEILNEQTHQDITHTPGRLLKARLKSLNPVMVDGPKICQCQGITSETRAPVVCNRRTYHRLMAMLSKGHSSSINGVNKPVSVHQTSEASSLDSGIGTVFITHHDLDKKHILEKSAENKIVNM